MADSYHIGGGPNDPENRYRVEKVQREHSSPGPFDNSQQSLPKSNQPALLAYFLLLFKKILDLFEPSAERGLSSSLERKIYNHLIALKTTLDRLKELDLGKDASFLNGLSRLWHELLEDLPLFNQTTSLVKELHLFIKSFQHYPEGQEHTLGYYLSEYAGQSWLPFPYMEMVSHLHFQHVKDPQKSQLSLWTHSIASMIKIVRKDS